MLKAFEFNLACILYCTFAFKQVIAESLLLSGGKGSLFENYQFYKVFKIYFVQVRLNYLCMYNCMIKSNI